MQQMVFDGLPQLYASPAVLLVLFAGLASIVSVPSKGISLQCCSKTKHAVTSSNVKSRIEVKCKVQ